VTPTKYTIVQHSGVQGFDVALWEHAVQSVGLSGAREESHVRLVGGVVFDSYLEAETYAEEQNYPDDGYTGLICRAPGTFSLTKIGGLRVYIPAKVDA
jgi:hypothetical protein